MEINWFTVVAQLLNFLLLVWLMKRFLYQPVLAAIEAREQKIKAQLNDASTQKTEAQAEREQYQQKNVDFDQRKQTLLATAHAEAQAERQQLLDEARQDADTLRAKQATAHQQIQEEMHDDLAQKTRQTVLSLTKKALTDLASAGLEAQALAVFIERLHHLQGTEKQGFIDAFQASARPVQVRSAFALSAEQQAELAAALTALIGTEAACTFTTAPELISGISLSANGYKLAWSVPNYLAELESNLSAATPQRAPAGEPEPEPEPESEPRHHASH
jgi:F-type H+-transporting ATPase subunit b